MPLNTNSVHITPSLFPHACLPPVLCCHCVAVHLFLSYACSSYMQMGAACLALAALLALLNLCCAHSVGVVDTAQSMGGERVVGGSLDGGNEDCVGEDSSKGKSCKGDSNSGVALRRSARNKGEGAVRVEGDSKGESLGVVAARKGQRGLDIQADSRQQQQELSMSQQQSMLVRALPRVIGGSFALHIVGCAAFFASGHFCEFTGLQYASPFIGFDEMDW